jgi:tetratricopeptide (TPR) repeat protein
MNDSTPAGMPAVGWKKASVAGVVVLALVGTGWGLVRGWRSGQDTGTRPADTASAAVVYRNTLPGVAYLGDEACALCHVQHAQTFRQHPMGRSAAPASAAGPEEYGPAAHDPFETRGFRYDAERRGGRVFHRETRRDAQGRQVAAVEEEAAVAIGSGVRGRSYLVDHDGYLYQSPLSWFAQKRVWDLSPGFDKGGYHFTRGIEHECLFCHTNRALAVEHTLNRFRPPVIEGYAIGCERCHGPGALHVAARMRGDLVGQASSLPNSRQAGSLPYGVDDTIVNPRQLPPALREAVCEQCHLEGETRVLRAGRRLFDYRPGLPLHAFWAVFVRPPQFTDNQRIVSHVEQMHASRCFQASAGRMGCISCHDPHERPAPEKAVAYFRGRCLECHREAGCGLDLPDRRMANGDNCMACHMARVNSSDVAHTAITDHRILRRPDDRAGPPPVSRLRPGEVPLLHFHRDLPGATDEDSGRDLALALIEQAGTRKVDATKVHMGRLALPLLEEAVRRRPDDVPALEAQAYALWIAGRDAEALSILETVLRLAPGRERSIQYAAFLAGELGRAEEALAYWRRLVTVNPWSPRYHFLLARHEVARGRWREALAECQASLRLNPADWEVGLLRIRCHLALGERDAAREEFARVLGLDPPGPDDLRRWFAEQVHEGYGK